MNSGHCVVVKVTPPSESPGLLPILNHLMADKMPHLKIPHLISCNPKCKCIKMAASDDFRHVYKVHVKMCVFSVPV